jgi:hypothetical protein
VYCELLAMSSCHRHSSAPPAHIHVPLHSNKKLNHSLVRENRKPRSKPLSTVRKNTAAMPLQNGFVENGKSSDILLRIVLQMLNLLHCKQVCLVNSADMCSTIFLPASEALRVYFLLCCSCCSCCCSCSC